MDDQFITVAIRLTLALLAGGIIGLERTYHGRPAGFRTHTLVCTSSTLLILVSVYQWDLLPNAPLETIRADPSRMAQGIMTGIGFLGAGVIVKERFAVRGLTTAASIWMTAAIGIVIGMGFYSAAALGAAMALVTLSVFRWVESIMPVMRYGKLKVRLPRQQSMSEDELLELVRAHDISANHPSYQLEDEGRIFQYEMSIRTRHAVNLRYLAETLSQMEQIQEFSIIPTSDKRGTLSSTSSAWRRAGVPTSRHIPSYNSPLTWPAAIACRSSGVSGNFFGRLSANSCGRYTPMPLKVNRAAAPCKAKSPCGCCGGLGTSTRWASPTGSAGRRSKAKSVNTSPFTTRKGADPSSGRAL